MRAQISTAANLWIYSEMVLKTLEKNFPIEGQRPKSACGSRFMQQQRVIYLTSRDTIYIFLLQNNCFKNKIIYNQTYLNV